MKTELTKKSIVANIVSLGLSLVLCFFYDLLYRKYFPYQYMKCSAGNELFQFGMPIIIFIVNWKTLKNSKTHVRLMISALCMLIVTLAFNYLITILNIDRPFSFGPGGGLLAI